MVLEVPSHTGEVHERLHASTTELLRVTDTRPLEDERGAEGAAADDDLFAGSEDGPRGISACEGLGGNGGDADGTAVLDDYFVYFGVAFEVQVGVLGPGAVDVGVGGVAAAAWMWVISLSTICMKW